MARLTHFGRPAAQRAELRKDLSKIARRVVYASLGHKFPGSYPPLPAWKAGVMADLCLYVLTARFPFDGEPHGLRRQIVDALVTSEQHPPEVRQWSH
ncbi:hypothetical protein AB1K70_19175 [Bremerella sp. JC770]|uniref:hypothetical protein n=1 Tax=Bremerella sp. JC770 TaxID=3232137 RepID=UPI00345B0CAF